MAPEKHSFTRSGYWRDHPDEMKQAKSGVEPFATWLKYPEGALIPKPSFWPEFLSRLSWWEVRRTLLCSLGFQARIDRLSGQVEIEAIIDRERGRNASFHSHTEGEVGYEKQDLCSISLFDFGGLCLC